MTCLLLPMAALLFTGCNGEEDIIIEDTVVATGTIRNVTSTGAVVELTITGPYEEAGICFGESDYPTIDDNRSVKAEGASECVLKNLEPLTKYFVRAYAVLSDGTEVYGAVDIFNTYPRDVPEISGVTMDEVLFTTARVSAVIAIGTEADVTERGFCYSTSAGATIEDGKQAAATNADRVEVTLTGLHENTAYYVRAYIIHDGTVSYGEETKFMTWASISLDSVYNVTSYRAFVQLYFRGRCLDDREWTDGGVCWSTSQTPTVDDNIQRITDLDIGYKDIHIAGLKPSTTYYFRAYVKLDDRIFYADEQIEIQTQRSFLNDVVSFSNSKPGETSGKYNCFYYDETQPGHGISCGSECMNELYIPLKEAVEKSFSLNSIGFTTNLDEAGVKILSFRVSYDSGGIEQAAYFDFRVSVDGNDRITASDLKWEHGSGYNTNAKTLYDTLAAMGDEDTLLAYFEFLLGSEFILDYQMEYDYMTGESVLAGYVIVSLGESGHSLPLSGLGIERTGGYIPPAWTTGY